jgi:hypothetical protein
MTWRTIEPARQSGNQTESSGGEILQQKKIWKRGTTGNVHGMTDDHNRNYGQADPKESLHRHHCYSSGSCPTSQFEGFEILMTSSLHLCGVSF